MTAGVRLLHRPGDAPLPRTGVVPKATSGNKQQLAVRDTLGQFLEANLMRPLWFDDSQQQGRLDEALDTMTLAERITIEIEMQSRFASAHSFDYDPLR